MTNTIEFVFFKIFVKPKILSLSFVGAINFISNETVTQELVLVDLWTAVPDPASINEAIYPP